MQVDFIISNFAKGSIYCGLLYFNVLTHNNMARKNFERKLYIDF